MTALQKLGVAVQVIVGGAEVAFAAAVEAPNHPGAMLGDVAVLAGAGAVLGLAAGIAYAQDTARAAAAPEPEAPASASTPLFEQPPRAEWDLGFAAGFAHAQQLAADEQLAAAAAEDPATQWDLSAVDDTHVMAPVVADAGDGWAAASGTWQVPVVEAPGFGEDLYSRVSMPPQLGDVTLDWFGAAVHRQRGAA